MGQTSSAPENPSKHSPKKAIVQSELISHQAYHQTFDQQNAQLKHQLELVDKYSATIPESQKQIQQLIETIYNRNVYLGINVHPCIPFPQIYYERNRLLGDFLLNI